MVWTLQVPKKVQRMNPESGRGGSPGFSGCTISAMALGLKRERFTSGEQKTQEF